MGCDKVAAGWAVKARADLIIFLCLYCMLLIDMAPRGVADDRMGYRRDGPADKKAEVGVGANQSFQFVSFE